MKATAFAILAILGAAQICPAQATQPGADSKPATTNEPGQQYPQIDSELHATFRVTAPQAQKVQVRCSKTYDMVKGDNGRMDGDDRAAGSGISLLLADH